MIRFRDIRIQRKLMLVILLGSTAVLVLACSAFVGYDAVVFRRTMVRDLTVLADVIGENSTAAVQFSAPSDAEKTLKALQFKPSVMAACIYVKDGSRFAAYVREGSQAAIPPEPGPVGHRFAPSSLVLVRPIMLERMPVGTIWVQADLQELGARLRTYAGIAGGVFVGAAMLAVLVAYRGQRAISRPIMTLAETARAVKEQRNYALRAPPVGRDEIGLLTEAFNQMLCDIERSQGALQEANRSLQAHAAQITESVGVLSAAVRHILDLSAQVAANATETAVAVSETTATVEEARQTSNVASERARTVADNSQEAATVSLAGRHATDLTIERMNQIRQQMESIAEGIVRLSEQSQAIGGIIATVDDIAEQSNLLAVNAAIEAAKAGEQGRGFAVVAQEIKNLAAQSKQATGQVRGILSDIQKATSAAVMATEQGGKAVEAGVVQSKQTGAAIDNLAGSIQEAAQASLQIAASSRQQVAGMSQVAQAMESIKHASAQNVDSMTQLKTAAQSLLELGVKLEEMVSRYRS